jgi:hypothetical protein
MSKVTHDELLAILGRIDDVKLAEVMALDPTRDEVIQAKLWLAQTDLHEVGAVAGGQTAKATRIYQMLRVDAPAEWGEE